jgi:hypothetical protein
MAGNMARPCPSQMARTKMCLTVAYATVASSFSRIFSQGQDWSGYQGLNFWFYGQNSGEDHHLPAA